MYEDFYSLLEKTFNYKRKSSKKEFLLVICFNVIIAVILGILGGILSEVLSNKLFVRLPNLYSLLSILPSIAMIKRVFNIHKKDGM
jgi:uncharacterized membrane protein YhaH (DUF805 family)